MLSFVTTDKVERYPPEILSIQHSFGDTPYNLIIHVPDEEKRDFVLDIFELKTTKINSLGYLTWKVNVHQGWCW